MPPFSLDSFDASLACGLMHRSTVGDQRAPLTLASQRQQVRWEQAWQQQTGWQQVGWQHEVPNQEWVLLTERRVGMRLDFVRESTDVRCVVHAGSVAEAMGLRTGSLLVAVRGVPTAGLSIHEVCGGPFSRNGFRCQI